MTDQKPILCISEAAHFRQKLNRSKHDTMLNRITSYDPTKHEAMHNATCLLLAVLGGMT